MKKLKQAYKRLDYEEYKGIIKDTLIPVLDEHEGDYITTLSRGTVFSIRRHYYNGMFMGWNIYADGVLLETKSSRKKARKYLRKIRE